MIGEGCLLTPEQPSPLTNPHAVAIDMALVHVTTDLYSALAPKEPP